MRRSEENLHLSDTWHRTRAVGPVAKRLAAWGIWPLKKTMTWIQSPLSHLKYTFIVTSPLWTNAFSSFCKITMPATLFMSQKKKHYLFEFDKLRPYWDWKAITSALAFGAVRFTTTHLQPLFAIRKIQSILYKIAPQVNRKSQHSSLLISDWLRDYPHENIVPLYIMVKYAQKLRFWIHKLRSWKV